MLDTLNPTGIFAGAMSKRFSPRITVMLFSSVAVLGLIVASIATSIPMLMIAFLATGKLL